MTSPRKAKARHAVAAAIRARKTAPSSKYQHCGQSGKLEAHHSDYGQPLEVKWLCSSCHWEYHGKLAFQRVQAEAMRLLVPADDSITQQRLGKALAYCQTLDNAK